MKKFKIKKRQIVMMGGVLKLTILLLSGSLLFSACSNGNDNSNSSPSPTLPANQGTNPIDEILGKDSNETSIKLNAEWHDIELQNNGVATTYIQTNEDHEDNTPLFEFQYTYNESKKEIYMHLERIFISKNGFYYDTLNSNEKWNTFNEIISVIEENYKEDNFIKAQKEYYDRHPYNYSNFDEYLNELKMNYNVETLDELIDFMKTAEMKLITKIFEAQITFRYEINEGKMTLTEKFTGMHNTLDNLLGSSCDYEGYDISLWITYDYASLNLRNQTDSPDYIGSFFSSTANEIVFTNENDKTDTITATYEEDIKNEIVTVYIKGEEYICKFHGNKYIQQ